MQKQTEYKPGLQDSKQDSQASRAKTLCLQGVFMCRIRHVCKLFDESIVLYACFGRKSISDPLTVPFRFTSDVNRISKDESVPPMKARILVMSVSGEASHQYIPIMNCIFAAQKAVSWLGV